MRVTIWSSFHADTPTVGPYKLLDTVELPALYSVGEMTHYGAAYAIGVAAFWKSLTRIDLEVFLAIGIVPAAVLLFFRPQRIVGSQ